MHPCTVDSQVSIVLNPVAGPPMPESLSDLIQLPNSPISKGSTDSSCFHENVLEV